MTQPEAKTENEAVNVQWAGSSCPHLHVIEASSGSWHFSDGEPWDNITTFLICLDCLRIIESAEDGVGEELAPLG